MEWMCLLRISKVTKNQGFTPLFRRYVFGKTARGGVKLTPTAFSRLSAKPTKWSDTLKQIIGKSRRIV